MKSLKDLAESRKSGYSTTVTFVIETMRDAIVRGIFTSGEKLRQDIIARQFEISAIPVREAFNALESQGLVKRIPNKGVFVSELSIVDMKEIYELRILLETKALSLALPYVSGTVLKEAEKLIFDSEKTEDPHMKSDLNWRFHTYIYGLSNRRRLLKLIKNTHYSVQHYIRLYTTIAGENKVSSKDHRIMLKKLAAGNEQDLVEFLESHIYKARDMLIYHFKSRLGGIE